MFYYVLFSVAFSLRRLSRLSFLDPIRNYYPFSSMKGCRSQAEENSILELNDAKHFIPLRYPIKSSPNCDARIGLKLIVPARLKTTRLSGDESCDYSLSFSPRVKAEFAFNLHESAR